MTVQYVMEWCLLLCYSNLPQAAVLLLVTFLVWNCIKEFAIKYDTERGFFEVITLKYNFQIQLTDHLVL
jgi:hypothetical protein